MDFDFTKAALPRFLQRYPERGKIVDSNRDLKQIHLQFHLFHISLLLSAIFAWLRQTDSQEWDYLPNEVNKEIRDYLRCLENYRISNLTIPYNNQM